MKNMKKLNYLLALLVLAVAFGFSSCNKSDDASIAINTDQEEITVDPTDVSTPFLTGSIVASNDYLDSTHYTIVFTEDFPLYITMPYYQFSANVYTKKDNVTTETFSYKLSDFGAYTTYLVTYAKYIKSIKITAYGHSASEVSKEVPVTIKSSTNLTESTFTWKRIGSADATGLSTFGLQWTSNNEKTVWCVIKPLDGAKLVELTAAQYTSITNYTDLQTAVDNGTALTEYKKISTEATSTYNNVIATKYNGKYYLINITKATIETATAGTTITITGNYKTGAATK